MQRDNLKKIQFKMQFPSHLRAVRKLAFSRFAVNIFFHVLLLMADKLQRDRRLQLTTLNLCLLQNRSRSVFLFSLKSTKYICGFALVSDQSNLTAMPVSERIYNRALGTPEYKNTDGDNKKTNATF